MARIHDEDVRRRALQRSAIESRLRALVSRGLTFTKQEGVGDIYIVQKVAIYFPAVGHWRLLDNSASGYTVEGLIDAVDTAQLRGMIPEGTTLIVIDPLSKELGKVSDVTEPSVPTASRDNVAETETADPDRPLNSLPSDVEAAVGTSSSLLANRWP